MSDRKAELELKKKKLAEMRLEKKKKEEERRLRESREAVAKEASSGQVNVDLHAETEKMLEDLGIPLSASSSGSARSSVSPARVSQPASTGPPESGDSHITIAPQSFSPKVSTKMLGVSKVTQTNIPPKETVAYSKETQTPVEPHDKEVLTFDTGHHTDDDADSLDVSMQTPPASNQSKPLMDGAKQASTPEADKREEKQEVLPPRELSEEEKKQILLSEDFFKFFDRTSRVVERALTEELPDFYVDYTGRDGKDTDSELQTEGLKSNRVFFDERWSKHRTVTCIDWSTQFPELLVASYNNNEESPHEPDGVTLVWNLKFKKDTPEYVFHCQSAVMSTCFAKFHPNLVVGGTYSGQIVLWDNRSNKRTPVQRTPLSAAAHTHPVYCVNVVGTQNAHNLISVSTDGKMCSWSLDMLSQPQDSLELQHKQSKMVAVTSFSFLSGDVNNFVVGSEEGAVYTACRHGSKAGISDMFEGHQGPVTGIDCNTVPGQVDFSQLFLTSSFDWTVKLWSIKEQRPLYSFEDNSDYVYDARWSPIHPALFASVDGNGRIDLWNLNNDTEVPTASTRIDGSAANRCRWHQSGHSLAVGDDTGRIHIYDVAEHIANPKNDEWTKFVHTLQDIKNNATDRDDDLGMTSPLR
ncbi:cytoplasmic dynein 1 intermediate chain 1-like isoform X2 [Tubulanus polymorphus]|uniref:cytoplasmic dynein 1 intermediate chain 1-like isoform X2 n=1 Tax=Tubulanus polymorphus TaxID=672921 RepID=UPI003DA276E5